MRRKQASALIDDIRVLVARYHAGEITGELAIGNVIAELDRWGLRPLEACGGEAHSNPFIDNCMRCAPRWGFVGAKEVVS